MALTTKPRWDKYDGYVGNFRGVLGEDISDNESNVVLGVGTNSDGGIVVGSGQTGIKGLMIVAVGADIHGNLLDGGINNSAGDPQDVGKHGEITNFRPTVFGNLFGLTAPGSGNYKVKVNGVDTADIAFGATASQVEAAIVAVDDGLVDAEITVSGTAPNFSILVTDDDVTLASGTNSTVAKTEPNAQAGTNYYAHADGTVNATKGGDGVYVGHTQEATRLIVNVSDATP